MMFKKMTLMMIWKEASKKNLKMNLFLFSWVYSWDVMDSPMPPPFLRPYSHIKLIKPTKYSIQRCQEAMEHRTAGPLPNAINPIRPVHIVYKMKGNHGVDVNDDDC